MLSWSKRSLVLSSPLRYWPYLRGRDRLRADEQAIHQLAIGCATLDHFVHFAWGVLCMNLQGARDDHRALVEFSVSAPTSFPIYISSFFFPNFYYLSTFNWGFVELDQLIIA